MVSTNWRNWIINKVDMKVGRGKRVELDQKEVMEEECR